MKVTNTKNSLTIISFALIVFGAGPLELVSTCFAQSPWIQIADLPVANALHSFCSMDGKLYVMGGTDHYSLEERENALFALEVYDPLLESWTTKADMSTRRANFSSCVYDGRILAIGGNKSIYYTPVSEIDAYDPLSDEWSTITHIPKAGVWQAAVVLDDKIYVFGGALEESEFPYSTVQVYDLLTDTWTEAAPMPTPRSGLSATVLDGKIYVLGGMQGVSADYIGLNTVEVFDPETNTWAKKTGMIEPRKNPQSCEMNGKIYVFGGNSGNGEMAQIGGEIYDPLTDSWKELYPPPRVLGYCAAAKLNGKVYVGGGISNPPEREKSIYTYDPHYDLLPLVESVYASKNSVNAGADTVVIVTKIKNPAGITIKAILKTLDGFPMDSVQLFDDGSHFDEAAGDGLFANAWPVKSEEELQYSLDLRVTRVETDTVVNQFVKRAIITTRGLVNYDQYIIYPDFVCEDSVPVAGACLTLKLTLKNNSSMATARNLRAELSSLDSMASFTSFSSYFEDVEAGETSESMNIYRLRISEECPDYKEIFIEVNIYSYGNICRIDTFSITVLPTSININDVSEPIIRIYPNPTNNLLTIETLQPERIWIEITSLNGQRLLNMEMEGSSHQVDLSSFHEGVYLVKVKSNNFIETRKLIKLD